MTDIQTDPSKTLSWMTIDQLEKLILAAAIQLDLKRKEQRPPLTSTETPWEIKELFREVTSLKGPQLVHIRLEDGSTRSGFAMFDGGNGCGNHCLGLHELFDGGGEQWWGGVSQDEEDELWPDELVVAAWKDGYADPGSIV